MVGSTPRSIMEVAGNKKKYGMKKSTVDHTYRDYSRISISDLVDDHAEEVNDELFPAKLHAILSAPKYEHIIAWKPHGRAWAVLDRAKFISIVLPRHFNHSNFESFNRSVNGWGFKRLWREGPDQKAYYHELFLYGRAELTSVMSRLINPGKRLPDKDSEPDFYEISRKYPLPNPPPQATSTSKDNLDSNVHNQDHPSTFITPPATKRVKTIHSHEVHNGYAPRQAPPYSAPPPYSQPPHPHYAYHQHYHPAPNRAWWSPYQHPPPPPSHHYSHYHPGHYNPYHHGHSAPDYRYPYPPRAPPPMPPSSTVPHHSAPRNTEVAASTKAPSDGKSSPKSMLPVLHSNQSENGTGSKKATEIFDRKPSPQTEWSQDQVFRDGSPYQYSRGDVLRSEVATSWQYNGSYHIGRGADERLVTQNGYKQYEASEKDDEGEHNPLDIDNFYGSPDGARSQPDNRRDRDRVVYPTSTTKTPFEEDGVGFDTDKTSCAQTQPS